MATQRVIVAAVDRAVETAVVDPDGSTHPVDERCRFDPAALAAVMAYCRSPQGREQVLDVVDATVQRWVQALDPARTLAAAVLVVRIEAGTQSRVLPVENIQGDVGGGLGSLTTYEEG